MKRKRATTFRFNRDEWIEKLMSGPFKLTADQAKRFVARVKVGKVDDCWEVPPICQRKPGGARLPSHKRYPQARLSATKLIRMSRIVAASICGFDIDATVFACHDCDNPQCVNPNHLWPGSNQENMDDCGRKGRRRRAKGEAHGKAKLIEAEVRTIRWVFRCHELTMSAIARWFGVTVQAVRAILIRDSWKDVED